MIEVDVKPKVGAFSLEAANDAGITALFGQSGSGKSVTLNLIAGLMVPAVTTARCNAFKMMRLSLSFWA